MFLGVFCLTTQLRKILTDNTTILEHQNDKQNLQTLEALRIRWTIHKLIPAEYNKSNTGMRTDPEENM